MNEETSRRVWLWAVFLFFLNLLYLIYELAFNSRLVDAAVANLTNAEVLTLELEGRLLSGLGLTLLLIRLISVNRHTWLRIIGYCALAFAVGVPSMFFGQRILVDHLVERTTAEQRMDAQHLLLLKRGLSNNAVQFEGIAFDEDDLDSPHTRSFLSVLGLMTFISPEFIKDLKQHSDEIIEEVAANEATQDVPQAYDEYRRLQEAIRNAWAQYERLSDEYWQAQAELADEAEAAWRDLQQDLIDEWEEIRERTSETQTARSVLRLQRNLDRYFEARNSCEDARFRDECIVKVEEVYEAEVKEALGEYVAPTEWCHEPETVRRTIRQGDRFVTQTEQVQRCRDLSFEHLESRLKEILGVPESFEDFLVLEDVTKRTRERVAEEGLELPDNWRPDDRDGFIDAYISEGSQIIGERLESEMVAEIGTTLPFDLDGKAFVASQPVQARLHDALRPLDQDKLIELDYDPETFRDAVITPHYVYAAERERERLYSDASSLGAGGEREEAGENYVRALIVPPIAMGFSLFFALFNAVGLLASLPTIVGAKRAIWGVLIKIGGLLAIVAVPMINSAAVTETGTYKYFEAQTEKALTPAGSLFSTWVVNTQPAVYQVGRHAMRIAPPLFSPDPGKVEAEKNNLEAPDFDTRVNRRAQAQQNTDEPAQHHTTVASESSEDFSEEASGEDGVRRVTPLNPEQPLAEQIAADDVNAVLVDTQQLSDDGFAIHRSPIIDGDGTCMTNYRTAKNLSEITRLEWRAARHGSCSGDDALDRHTSIPLLEDFARQLGTGNLDVALWAHFQPTLYGEVDCRRIRGAADDLSQIMDSERFVAVVSNTKTLSCFARHQRDYPLAYLGPEYGEASSADEGTPRHLSLSEVKRLRERAGGQGYRKHALQVSDADLETFARNLEEKDLIILHEAHWNEGLSEWFDSFDGRSGVFGTDAQEPDDQSNDVFIQKREQP